MSTPNEMRRETADQIDGVKEFEDQQRREWDEAARGWDRWHDVLEGPTAGRVQTDKLVDLAGIGAGDIVLDVATGCGEPGLTAARWTLPGGTVVCSDISAKMVDVARRRAHEAGLDNVQFVTQAAEDLEFGEGTFDAILCRHGLQFVVDVPATLRRLHTFLKDSGRLAAIVWGPSPRVQFSRAMVVILQELQLPPPPADRPGIFALGDAAALGRMVEEGGFRHVETGTLEVVYHTPTPEHFTRLVRDISPPITQLLDGRPTEVAEKIWNKVTDSWRDLTTSDGTRITCEAIWVAGER